MHLGDRVLYSSIDGPHLWRKIVRITRHIQYNSESMVRICKKNYEIYIKYGKMRKIFTNFFFSLNGVILFYDASFSME